MVDITATIEEPEEINVTIEAGAGVTNFRALTDTQSTYVDQANKFLKVTGAEDGIEFVSSTASISWGGITGTLSNQADLQTELDLKADKSNVLELDNTTSFTPDADYEPATKKYVDDNSGGGAVDSVNGEVGVVVLTTGDIAEDINANYVSDAELIVIGNTSGTNTGDQVIPNVDDTAYNETSWDANTDAATKNSIRDKIETMDTAIGLNTSKVTNVSTDLSEGTSTETTVDIDSSDGTNATLVSASATRAGLLTKAKYDEIVVNNAKVSYTDAAAVGSNTTHRGLTNNPHSVDSGDVGLSNVSDVATDDTAYNATSWDTNSDSATKNSIRDKIETMDTAIGLNTSKVTNATHTGEVTGSGILTVDKTSITNKTLVTAIAGDQVLITDGSDTDNLKRVNVSDFLGGGGSGDVSGPGVAVDENITVFDSTTGKLIKDSGTNISAVTTNTSKVTNATHTGDVTGSTALTIATDAVDIAMLSATGTPSSATFLRGDNTWVSPSGSGDVTKVGTPIDNQIGVWTGDGTIEGTTGLTYDGTTFDVDGEANIFKSDTHGELNVGNNNEVAADGFGGFLYIGKFGAPMGSSSALGAIYFESKTTDSITHVAAVQSNVIVGNTTRSLTTGNLDLSTKPSGVDDPISRIRIDENGNMGFGGIITDFAFTGADMVLKNGKLGIGIVTATEALDVVGNIAVSGNVDGIDIATDVAANTSKVSNVSTNLSEGTSTTTTVDVNSSDGTNATLVSASTIRAGLLTKAKWDEIVVNNAKISYTDSSAVGLNTTHRTSDGSDHSFINQDVTTTGTPTFGITTLADSSQLATSAAPTTDADIANKKYVDDNSGGAPEGTAVKSTGEGGGTKFLREDGDGTSSWQVPSGSGDVTGPSSATDNAIATYNSTTGKLIKDSGLISEGNKLYQSGFPTSYIKFNDGQIEIWAGGVKQISW